MSVPDRPASHLPDWFLHLIDRRALRRAAVALAAVFALALLPGLAGVRSNNAPEAFFLEGSPRVERYYELRELFGADQVVRLAARGPGVWTSEGLGWLREVEEAASALAGVEAVLGPTGEEMAPPGPWPPPDPSAFRQRLLDDPLARGLGWVAPPSEEPRAPEASAPAPSSPGAPSLQGVLTILVRLMPAPAAEQREVLDRLREVVAEPPAGMGVEVVGLPVLDAALDGSSREIAVRFFPLLVLFTVILLAALFRDLRTLAAPLAFVSLGELTVLGSMGYLGVELNLVLAVVPPLLFVVGLATAVHVLVAFREQAARGLTPEDAVRATYEDKGWAVFWTGLTTMAGFGSLMISPVAPVRSLGLWTTVGVGALTVAAFSIYPVLLVSWVGSGRGRRGSFESSTRHQGRRWADWAASNRRPLLAAAGILATLAILGLPRLRVESNALTYLPADHPARAGIQRLEDEGVGTAVVELVLSRPMRGEGDGGFGDPGFDDPAAGPPLAELARELEEVPDVLGAVGAGDIRAAAERRAAELGVSALPGAAALGAAVVQARTEEALRPFLTADGGTTRLLLFVEVTGEGRMRALESLALRLARDHFPGARAEVSGQYMLLLETQRRLIVTLWESLSLTFLAVAVILRLLLGSTRLALLALVPNLWPVVGVLGVMSWAGLPLDIATVMVASVLLGLAVDDTIHTLGHFRELAPRVGSHEAVAGTMEHTAAAYLLTGIILAAGFGVCALSDFAPTARFGLLSAVGIALAVVADLFLLPALLGGASGEAVAKMGRGRRER